MDRKNLVDFSHVATYLRANPPKSLPWPQQAAYGNCWLLAALVGVGMCSLLSRVALHSDFALVTLAQGSVRVDYWLPPDLVALRRPEDLYCALLCKAVCMMLQSDTKKGYSACDGGHVPIALAMLGNRVPLTFCETYRGTCLHSLLLLESRDFELLCYDPQCGNPVVVSRQSCMLLKYGG